MKKLLLILLVFILLGGTVFFFGWVQFSVPAGSAAVIFTKTHGWEAQVVEPGTFAWRWQRLIPTNMTLHVFDLSPFSQVVSSEGTLPSADLYSQYIEGEADFSFRIEVEVSFAVAPEELPRLAQEEAVTPDTLTEWYESVAATVRRIATEAVTSTLARAAEGGQDFTFFGLEEQIISRLRPSFPHVEFISVVPAEVSLPDLDLYARAQEVYFLMLEARGQAVAEATYTTTRSRLEDEYVINALRSYAEILSANPALLDYFRLSAEEGVDPLNLEALRPEADAAAGNP